MASIGGLKINPLKGTNSLLGDPMGWDAQEKANQANDERYKLALQLFDQGVSPLNQSFVNQRSQIAGAMGETRAGAQRSLGELATLGARGVQGARDAGTQALGQGTLGLIQGGLSGSSHTGALARGVAADTARNIQGVNENVAGARVGVNQDETARLAQLKTMLGNSYANQGSALAQWRLSKINAILNRQDVAGPGWLGQTLDVAKSFASLAGGGK